MATYVVTQDGAFFAVRLGDSSGPVIATFSNSMAAEAFAEKQRVKDQDAAKIRLTGLAPLDHRHPKRSGDSNQPGMLIDRRTIVPRCNR